MPNTNQGKDYVTPSEMREYVIRAIQDATELIMEAEEKLRNPLESKVLALTLERARREGIEEQKKESDAKMRNILIVTQIVVGLAATLAIKFIK